MIDERAIDQIREGYRALNDEQRIDDSYVADDFLLEQNPGLPGTRAVFHGPEGMRRSLQELLDGFDAVRFDPKRFDVHGDWLIVPVEFWASARGFEQRADIVHLWRLRGDGKAVRMRVLGADADPLHEISKLSQ